MKTRTDIYIYNKVSFDVEKRFVIDFSNENELKGIIFLC